MLFTEISTLEKQLKEAQNEKERLEGRVLDHNNFMNKCAILEEYQQKAEKHLAEKDKEIRTLNSENITLKDNIAAKVVEFTELKESVIKELNEKEQIIKQLQKDNIYLKDAIQKETCK